MARRGRKVGKKHHSKSRVKLEPSLKHGHHKGHKKHGGRKRHKK